MPLQVSLRFCCCSVDMAGSCSILSTHFAGKAVCLLHNNDDSVGLQDALPCCRNLTDEPACCSAPEAVCWHLVGQAYSLSQSH